jgi:eukaryotic-like serine/threonine-protein kinase
MKKVRLFISSPADVTPERERAELVAQRLSGELGDTVAFEVVRWEDHFYSAHATVQAQIPEAAECDIVVAVLWKRLGTPLPDDFRKTPAQTPYPSGTAYEILSAIEVRSQPNAQRPDIYVFQKSEPPTFSESELDQGRQQLLHLREFMVSLQRNGRLLHQFETTDEFGVQLERLLRNWINTNLRARQQSKWPTERESPFRGLAPFEARHSDVFFGRARRTARAIDALKQAYNGGVPFLLIVGPSGSGKSSLMRAGLMPRLTTRGVVPLVEHWRTAVMHPAGGATPFEALAQALVVTGKDDDPGGFGPALPELLDTYKNRQAVAQLLQLGAVSSNAVADPKATLGAWEPAVHSIVSALEAATRALSARSRTHQPARTDLLLLIDQFEELFAPSTTAEQRAGFAQLLHALARSQRVWIVATLRANMMGDLILNRPLFALKDAGTSYELGPPGEAELTEIVQKSAEAAGLAYGRDPATGERLDDLILRDAFGGDTLPLLEFTLNSLYQKRVVVDGQAQLTVQAYSELGGLDGAINYSAEQAIASLGEAEQNALPRLISGLVVGPQDTSRPLADTQAAPIRVVTMAEACPDETSRRLVNALVDARILLAFRADNDTATGKSQADHAGAAAAYLRIAHERVLRSWTRAKKIIEELGDYFRIRTEVENQWRNWVSSGRRPDSLITAEVLLGQAEQAVATYGHLLATELRDFVTASTQRARRNKRARRAAVVILLAALVVAVAAGGVAYRARENAQHNYEQVLRTIDNFTVTMTADAQERGIGIGAIRKILDFGATTLEQLQRQDDSPDLNLIRAKLLFNLAKISQLANDWRRATVYADESLALRQRLAQNQSDPAAAWNLSLSLELAGDLSREGKKKVEAREYYLKSLALRQRLHTEAPDDVEKAIGLSQINVRLGDLAQTGQRRAFQYAADHYAQALRSLQHVIRKAPDTPLLQREVSWVYGKLGDVSLKLNRREGLNFLEHALCVRRRLVGLNNANGVDNQTITALRDLSWSLARIAQARLDVDSDVARAEDDARDALAIRKHLSSKDLANVLFLGDLGNSRLQMAQIKIRQGQLTQALALAQAALSIRRQLAQQPASAWRNKDDLTRNETMVADLCSRMNKNTEACLKDETSWTPFVFEWELETYSRFLKSAPIDDVCWHEVLSSLGVRDAASK